MTLAIFLLLLGVFCAIVGAFFYARKSINDNIEALRSLYDDFVTVDKDTGVSPLEETLDSISHIASKRLISTLTAQNMQQSSADARTINNLEKDLALDSLEQQQPAIMAVLDMLPNVKKRVLKNPRALGLAMPMIQKILQKSPPGVLQGSSFGNNNGKSDVQKRIGME